MSDRRPTHPSDMDNAEPEHLLQNLLKEAITDPQPGPATLESTVKRLREHGLLSRYPRSANPGPRGRWTWRPVAAGICLFISGVAVGAAISTLTGESDSATPTELAAATDQVVEGLAILGNALVLEEEAEAIRALDQIAVRLRSFPDGRDRSIELLWAFWHDRWTQAPTATLTSTVIWF